MCECCGPSEKEKQEWEKAFKEREKKVGIEAKPSERKKH